MITITSEQFSTEGKKLISNKVFYGTGCRNFADKPVITLGLTPEMRAMSKDQIHAEIWNNVRNGNHDNCPYFKAISTVMSNIQDATHWKNPFGVVNPTDETGADLTQWVDAASIWFHASETVVLKRDGYIIIWNNGYAAW